MNLVGPATLPDFWSRHAWDSAQLLPLAPEALTWADLGAGAGLPGVVLAILLQGPPGLPRRIWSRAWPSAAASCSEVVEALELPATVHNAPRRGPRR